MYLINVKHERLRNRGSTPDARPCVFGKDTLPHFPSWGEAVYPSWWPRMIKACKQNCSVTLRQTQNMFEHCS